MKIAQVISDANATSLRCIAVALAQSWQGFGEETDIICFKNCERFGDFRVRTVNILGYTRHSALAYLVNEIGKKLFGRHLIHFAYARWTSCQFERFLKENGYDAVVFHDESHLRFHHIHVPHTKVSHNITSKALLRNISRRRGVWKRRLLQKLCADTCRNKCHIAVSDDVRDDLIQHLNVNPDKVKRIYNPFNTERVRQQCTESAPPHPRPYILGAGRLCGVKNFPLLVRAYAEVRCEEDLVIIGDGRDKADLQRLAEQLGIRDKVQFAGFQSNPYPWFKHANLFVLSSNHEGLGMVILEAITFGTSVVSTDCHGAGELMRRLGLQDYLVLGGDVNALAEKITTTLKLPPSLKEAQEKLRLFSPDHIARQYLDVMRATVANDSH